MFCPDRLGKSAVERKKERRAGGSTTPVGEKELWHINVRGVMQGVGFRPFVYQLTTDLLKPSGLSEFNLT
jgi:hypothetical protein